MDALATLQRLGGGTLIGRLHEALVTTADEVIETGNTGTVTLTLKLAVQNQGDPFVAITESIGRSVPKKKARGTFVFALDGEFYTEDPRQTRLEFREIDKSTGEIREVETREKVERSI